MEAITRLVADSLARHGFDRPVDPRRLQWSRWFRCDSPHSLLTVPSKPGIFALSEEIMDLGTNHGGTDALVRPAERSSAAASTTANDLASTVREGHDFSRAENAASRSAALAAEVPQRRMLAVLQFSEDDDMAFTLDRMFTRINPMRERLASGKCFLRFVVIEDQSQRRSICAALNQWMAASAEKSTGLPAGFSTSLEFTTDRGATDALVRPVDTTDRVGPALLSDSADTTTTRIATDAFLRPADTVAKSAPAPLKSNISAALQSGAAKNLHCPHPLPSGF
jgi:hypothetical protein